MLEDCGVSNICAPDVGDFPETYLDNEDVRQYTPLRWLRIYQYGRSQLNVWSSDI